MGTDLKPARQPKSESKRRKKLLRLAAAIATGVGIGYICPLLPEAQQVLCHAAAKVIGFLVGGHF